MRSYAIEFKITQIRNALTHEKYPQSESRSNEKWKHLDHVNKITIKRESNLGKDLQFTFNLLK